MSERKPSTHWIDQLVENLGLDDTPVPVAEKTNTLLDAIRRLESTGKGWRRVKAILNKASTEADVSLFKKILHGSKDDMEMFVAILSVPYMLMRAQGYKESECVQLLNVVLASYVVAITRGYSLGIKEAQS